MWMFWHVLSAAYYVGWMLFWLGMLAFIFYLIFSLMKPKFPQLAMAKKDKYKVVDLARPYVYAFRSEPSLKDIVLLNDELHIAQLELAGDIVQLNNDTVIKILEDDGKEAVKIKVKNTKTREKVFWVPRSAIVKSGESEKPKLLGP